MVEHQYLVQREGAKHARPRSKRSLVHLPIDFYFQCTNIQCMLTNTRYSQTSIIRRSMGEQICAGLHRMSDYQIASIIRH